MRQIRMSISAGLILIDLWVVMRMSRCVEAAFLWAFNLLARIRLSDPHNYNPITNLNHPSTKYSTCFNLLTMSLLLLSAQGDHLSPLKVII